MSLIFIDGPDYSGKTTKAKRSEHYREWSSTPLGQELRAYFISAEKSTEETVQRSLEMWRNWMELGLTEDIVLDRSPLSTMAEQILGDLDKKLFNEYMEGLMAVVKEVGLMVINVIIIDDEVLVEREGRNERVKDKRESMRTTEDRNALYKRAILDMADAAPHYDVTVSVDPIGDEMIAYSFTPRNLPMKSFFGELRFDCSTEGESLSTTLGDPSHYLAHAPSCVRMSVIEALDLAKYITIKHLEHNGVSESCNSSVMTVAARGELILSPKQRFFPSNLDVSLVNGYLARIIEMETYNMGFTVADYYTLVNEGTTTISRLKFNYFSVQVLAAYFIYKLNEDTP